MRFCLPIRAPLSVSMWVSVSVFVLATAVLAIIATTASFAQAPGSPSGMGRWITESGNLEVELAPCGDAVCGTVVRVLANRSMSAPGQEATPADTTPALGMVILSELRATDDGQLKGRIYNREKARHYSVIVKPGAPDQLLVRGYIGLPMFGETQVWRRASASEGKP